MSVTLIHIHACVQGVFPGTLAASWKPFPLLEAPASIISVVFVLL